MVPLRCTSKPTRHRADEIDIVDVNEPLDVNGELVPRNGPVSVSPLRTEITGASLVPVMVTVTSCVTVAWLFGPPTAPCRSG